MSTKLTPGWETTSFTGMKDRIVYENIPKRKLKCCKCDRWASRKLYIDLEPGAEERCFCSRHKETNKFILSIAADDARTTIFVGKSYEFMDKDVIRLAAKIGQQLAQKSPFMNILGGENIGCASPGSVVQVK